MLEFAGKKILLCSDIEKFAQRKLLTLYPNLKADVIVAPHHGSVSTLEPGFLGKLDADIRICNCGRTDLERQRVIKPKDKRQCFYTAKDGAVTVRVATDGGIKALTFNSDR